MDTTTVDPGVLATLEHRLETLADELAESRPDLFPEDADGRWADPASDTGTGPGLSRIQATARRARVAWAQDALLARGVSIRTGYTWGGGWTVSARHEDVQAVIDAFNTDPTNEQAWTGQRARLRNDRGLQLDGNLLVALLTDPATGRVRARTIPLAQASDPVCDPEDAAQVRYWPRTYMRDGRHVTVYHPDLAYRPWQRPRAVDGCEVLWDVPVLHIAADTLPGWTWAVPEVARAIRWAAGYASFLHQWARLTESLSKIAWKATAPTGRAAQRVRDALNTRPAGDDTVVHGDGQKFEAVTKTGATIDSNSGRPLAAMVASALDVPVTMLTSDPGVTGARATAETLDEPMRRMIRLRQSVWADAERRILDHAIDAAITAPAGPLNGTVTIDRATDTRTVTLAGDADRTVDVDWPALHGMSMGELVSTISEAHATGLIPGEVSARLLLIALDVDDADEIVADMVDPATGEFVAPNMDTLARLAQSTAYRPLPGE